jgi:pimeloyl-ACP methyl ester carboxylesterase
MLQTDIHRTDLHVSTREGVRIFVRELRGPRDGPAVVLAHGARVPGLGSFDLPVPGGSLAQDLAGAGWRVYLFDARNYGRSDRDPRLDRPAHESPPLSRAFEVLRDMGAVVREAMARQNGAPVALLGWATGAMWSGYYASIHPENVSHLIYYNGLYGGSSEHPTLGHGSAADDPGRPGRFHDQAFGGWRLNTAASLVPNWDRAFDGDPADCRDPRVLEAYMAAALASDPSSAQRDPPSFRSPSGAVEDSYYQACGRQLFDAGAITGHVQSMTLPAASHYVHLDRDSAGRTAFLDAVLAFLRRGREIPTRSEA